MVIITRFFREDSTWFENTDAMMTNGTFAIISVSAAIVLFVFYKKQQNPINLKTL